MRLSSDACACARARAALGIARAARAGSRTWAGGGRGSRRGRPREGRLRRRRRRRGALGRATKAHDKCVRASRSRGAENKQVSVGRWRFHKGCALHTLRVAATTTVSESLPPRQARHRHQERTAGVQDIRTPDPTTPAQPLVFHATDNERLPLPSPRAQPASGAHAVAGAPRTH